MNELDIIKALRATNSRLDKERVLTEAFKTSDRTFFTAARLCLDPLITFGVKKVPEILEDDGSKGTFTFQDFLDLTGKLQRRELTGHAARDAIVEAINAGDFEQWNLFYRPILLKDLKAGVDCSTINKVLSSLINSHPEAANFMIPVFGVQLAKDGADEKNAKKIAGLKLLDMKLDGMRFATILDKENGTVTQFTRSGHENSNFPAIREALEKMLPALPSSIVLDAEVMSENFQKLMTQARRKKADTSDAYLAIFDMIPLDDFRNGSCAIPQFKRHEMLCELQTSGLLSHISGSMIYVMPKVVADLDTEEGQETLRKMRADAERLGFEGVMVKDPNAGYAAKRTDAWLKIKPTITLDLTIVGLNEGTDKYTGMLGAIVCEGHEDGKHIVVNVGSGFSDEERAEIWRDKTLAMGQIVEIEADAITKSRDKETYGLRFPTLKRWRSVDRIPGEKD